MIGLGTATAQLDTAVNIAFPAITRGFDLAIGDIQWVVICYVLTYASLLLALGRIGDTIGHAVVYRAGLICSAVALLLVGYAPSYGAMLVFRCLQGIGAALVMSCGAALVTSPLRRGAAQPGARHLYHDDGAGLMLGPLLGGALVAIWDWPAVFWFRIPIAIAALLLLRGLPASQPRAARERFDIPGGIALALGLVTMLMAFNRIREFSAIWLGLLSVAGLCGLHLPAVPRGASDHRLRGVSPAGLCDAQPCQRARQSRGLFGLAAGALLSGPRDRLFAGGERRHSGVGRGRCGAGGADRRPPDRAAVSPLSGWRSQAPSSLAPAFPAECMDRTDIRPPCG